jgi:PhnB protein
MATRTESPVVSMMLAVPDTQSAIRWYARALGATILWDLGSVAGLEIGGAPFFLGEPAKNGWDTPASVGTTTLRVELFCDDPDAVIEQAVREGARQERHVVRNHQMPWGTHRQGGFVDPFGHLWFVGDRSPLRAHAGATPASDAAPPAPNVEEA